MEIMRVHNVEKIEQLKRLRKKGYSINELAAKLVIPKTTVWHHIHGVKVLPKYLPMLNAKRGGSKKRAQRDWELAKNQAVELLAGPQRELLIILSALYWCEGSKKVCELINSDGQMIKVYLFILRRVFSIPEQTLKATLRIFSGMNRIECLHYWSVITQIPENKFIVRLNDGGTRGRTPYGMCRITVKKGSHMLKLIHSLIGEFSGNILN